ncbi:MAG: outer membrane beta-barrel protein [Bdellovibrionaceae bacterium]|nr:outer membrane beta-barrel protein [Pseudobdellovibrionaceae bacterium]
MGKFRALVLLLTLCLPVFSYAQYDGEDAYDPFADYSEFDEASEEEADINFFRHGRFFTIGFGGGLRGFTENMAKVYSSNPTYGLFMSYFFDLRTAAQFGFLTGDHAFDLSHPSERIAGNVSFTIISLDYKYFLTSQNVTRGLADLNPYVIGGLAQVYRTISITGDTGGGRDATMGLSLGGGIEIPIMRKKNFIGIQGVYRYFNFKDENKNVVLPQSQITTSTKVNGDSFDIVFLLGSNF